MTKNLFWIIGSLIVVLMLAQGTWCAEPIKIGLIGALSAPYGASNKLSLEISIEELNNAGGILGRPVKLIVEGLLYRIERMMTSRLSSLAVLP